jgi:putative membrane protein
MKLGIALLTLLGVAAAVLIAAWLGFAAVGHALELAGWRGLAAISAYHLLPLLLCGLAWRALFPMPPGGAIYFAWFRWVRDAGGDLLAIIPGAGEMLGIRAMKLAGIETATAAATTIVDLTMEIGAQIAFTILGVAILLGRPENPLAGWALLGLAALLSLAGGLFLAQRWGAVGILERLGARLARDFGWRGLAFATGLDERIQAIYRNRRALARALATHFTAWLVGIGEAGIALAMMGVRPGLGTLIALESLSFALRSAAFFVPAAAGVQEGGYALLGQALGIGPDIGLAISLLKRGRELVLGAAALLLWHAVESRRLWRHARFDSVAAAPIPVSEARRDSRSLPYDRRHP